VNSRVAGPTQGAILLAMSCLPILGGLVIAPVLPAMEANFADTPGAHFLVPLTLTIPSLMIAAISPVASGLAARFGRRPLLLAALFLYAAMGLLPLIMNSLMLIVASRIFLGAAEAIVITISTALIGDYFAARTRERYLSLQVMLTSVSAVIFLLIGGWMGQHGWRVPFSVYAVSLAMVPFVMIGLWEPQPRRTTSSTKSDDSFPWAAMLPFYCVAFCACMCFNLLSVTLSYVVREFGTTSSFVMGQVNALNSAAIGFGTLFSVFFSHSRTRMCAGMLLAAAGLLVVASSSDLLMLSLGTAMSGIGDGIFFAHLLSGSMRILDVDQRTRGTGIYMASFFLANVVGPMGAIGIGHGPLGLKGAIGLFGAGLGLLGVAAWFLLARIFSANLDGKEAFRR